MKKQTKKDDNELLTRKEFTATHEAFKKEINERFDKVDEKFNAVDKRFDKVDEKFNAVDKRFDKVELALQNQAKALIKHDERFDLLEAKITANTDRILSAVDNIANDVKDCLRKEIVNTHRINEIETTVSNLDKRVTVLESTQK